MIKKNKKHNYRKKSEEVLFQRKVRHLSGKCFKILQIAFVIAFISTIIWYEKYEGKEIVSKELNKSIENLFLKAGLEIKEIEIEGNSSVTNEQIISAIFNDGKLYNKLPTMFIDVDEITSKIQQLGWVKEVHIKKKLPQKIIVNVVEREPAVLWKDNDEVWLTDNKGNKITKNIEPVYLNLPYIIGANHTEDVKNAFDILQADKNLLHRVSSIRKIGKRRWDIELDNKIKVSLPEKEPAKAWLKLSEVNKNKKILSKEIQYIDFRIEGQITAGLYEKNSTTSSYN